MHIAANKNATFPRLEKFYGTLNPSYPREGIYPFNKLQASLKQKHHLNYKLHNSTEITQFKKKLCEELYAYILLKVLYHDTKNK